ncbi:hypothetical protein [Patulibacter americanus]|uniref:hypothetical protein n=1 Tax=Patulibacter americanus TaxID=588672 RepID=UPI0012F9DD02|nr:hypothetical protein [Patulibacter americanus]
MSPRIRRRRRLGAALVALLAGAPAAALLLDAPDAVRAQSASGPVGIESQIGPASHATLLGGAAQGGAPNEAWGFTDADATVPQPKTVDGAELPETPTGIVRYRPDEGWRTVQSPQDEQGAPYPGDLTDGRVTARGGLVLAGNDRRRPEGQRAVLLARDAVGPTRVLSRPGTDVLRPGSGSTPDESLSPTVFAGRALADGRTEVFAGIAGRPLEDGIARWDGNAWSREQLCVADDAANTTPAGCDDADTLDDSRSGLTLVSAAASEGGSAWLLARAHADAGRGLVLFERTGEGPDVRWRLRDLGAPRFAADATPADGITEVAGLPGGRALTSTAGGVWIDATFRQNGTVRSVILHRTASGTRTWCDGGLCDDTLGFDVSRSTRSQAFAGPGDGTRVIGLGARYATFDGRGWSVSASFGAGNGGIAFSSLTEGWIGDVHITTSRPASPLAAWSVPVRRPLTAVASAPGTPGDIGTPALAVGLAGNVLRYTPGQGWDSEVRLEPGGVARDNLRGVAWPTADTAYAVGDEGTMWRWRRVTGLWESDPAAPYDFVGHLTGIAFQPGDPERGFAVGRDGVLLRYGKSWEPMELPADAATAGPGGGKADLYGVAFAGSQALAAAGSSGVLVEDGSGWKTDEGVAALMKRSGGRVLAVAGLPDGGAVAVGTTGDDKGLVMERDRAGGPWRFSDQPLTGSAIAVAAFREGERVRALVSVSNQIWPTTRDTTIPAADPALPSPRRDAFSLPAEGYLLRETAAGWRDEERTKLSSPTSEQARKSDPNLAIVADATGRGWAVGGWNGAPDLTGHGNARLDEEVVEAQTASVSRYDPAGPQGSSNVALAAPAMPAGRARLLVGGHAACASACADLAPIDTAPDRTLSRAAQLANQLGAEARGPRAFVYTGGRVAPGAASAAEHGRYGALLAGNALPTFPAVAPGDLSGGGSASFEAALAGAAAPFGQSPAAGGTTPVTIGEAPAPGRARTHYAVDVTTGDGPVRLVVIDNAGGSLAARNAAGNPAQDQAAWLTAVLADAKTRGIAVVVSGSRSLDSSDTGAASDAGRVAALLRDGGASAYVYDGDGSQRRSAIPFGSGSTIPTFSSGTLGYRPLADPEGRGVPGLLLLELDLAARNATTNRAPAAVRLIPVLDDLAIDAVDGRVLNRSQPALFEGLGRRPRSGSRWTAEGAGDGDGADAYVSLPSPICAPVTRAACAATRIDPEVTFTSSDPDIANFVRVDPSSTNPRKPFVDPATDKPVADPTSGLVCPFNAGTTTISISSGGLTYKTTLTVRDGSVLRPCGTVPLNPSRFTQPSASAGAPAAPPPPGSAPPNGSPAVDVPIPAAVVPPPPVLPAPAPPVTPAAVTPPPTPRPAPTPARPLPLPGPAFIAPLVPGALAVPPPPAAASPAPPPGTSGASINVPVSQPVTQAERQRDEEVAEESSKAYARYDAVASQDGGHGTGQAAAVIGLVLIAAIGGGTAVGTRRRRQYPYDYARATTRDHDSRVTARHRRPR